MTETQSVNLVLEKVSFVSKISIILKASSDDDNPIPGYLYQEVSNITLESDGYCESTLEYLVDRLEKNSHHVKLKVLKLMKYIVEHGNPNFRLGLIKSAHGIMAATKFSGPADPLHGNVPYQLVRKAAQELSSLLFDTEQADSKESVESIPPKTYIGLGPTDVSRSSGTMEGFGNSPASSQNKSFGESVMDNLGKIMDKITEGPADYQNEVLSMLEQSKAYKPPESYHGNQLQHVNQQLRPKRAPIVKHTPGRAGGGWEEDDDEEEELEDGEKDIKTGSQSSGKRSSDNTEIVDRLCNETQEDWSAEENHVKSLVDCEDNILLTRQEIVSFMKHCGQLNCDKVLEYLNQRLGTGSDAINMRSLLLVENFLTKDYISIDRVIKQCKDKLLSLYWSADQGPVKSKTKKIIRTLEKLQNVIILDDNNKDTTMNLITISDEIG